MKQQHETKALDGLDRHSTAGHGVEGHLQEIVREGTESGLRSWHGGILSLPGFLGSLPPATKSPQKRRRYLWNGPLRSVVEETLEGVLFGVEAGVRYVITDRTVRGGEPFKQTMSQPRAPLSYHLLRSFRVSKTVESSGLRRG